MAPIHEYRRKKRVSSTDRSELGLIEISPADQAAKLPWRKAFAFRSHVSQSRCVHLLLLRVAIGKGTLSGAADRDCLARMGSPSSTRRPPPLPLWMPLIRNRRIPLEINRSYMDRLLPAASASWLIIRGRYDSGLRRLPSPARPS